MDNQMSLFARGGLNDEGGEIDEVSGNSVPIGGTKEGVRDDIPANVSEGEFVMPADVVRYHGLDKMMDIRQEAKMGLKKMEAMGQMGNSDEATMPDDMPFEMADLVVVGGKGEPMEFANGGFVPVQNFDGGGLANHSHPHVGRRLLQTAYVPTFTRKEIPDYNAYMNKTVLVSKEYRNAAGESVVITFINGTPHQPIPLGYTLYVPPVAGEGEAEVTAEAAVVNTVNSNNDRGDPSNQQEVQTIDYNSMTPTEFADRMVVESSKTYRLGQGVAFAIASVIPFGGTLAYTAMRSHARKMEMTINSQIENATTIAEKTRLTKIRNDYLSANKLKPTDESNALAQFVDGFLVTKGFTLEQSKAAATKVAVETNKGLVAVEPIVDSVVPTMQMGSALSPVTAPVTTVLSDPALTEIENAEIARVQAEAMNYGPQLQPVSSGDGDDLGTAPTATKAVPTATAQPAGTITGTQNLPTLGPAGTDTSGYDIKPADKPLVEISDAELEDMGISREDYNAGRTAAIVDDFAAKAAEDKKLAEAIAAQQAQTPTTTAAQPMLMGIDPADITMTEQETNDILQGNALRKFNRDNTSSRIPSSEQAMTLMSQPMSDNIPTNQSVLGADYPPSTFAADYGSTGQFSGQGNIPAYTTAQTDAAFGAGNYLNQQYASGVSGQGNSFTGAGTQQAGLGDVYNYVSDAVGAVRPKDGQSLIGAVRDPNTGVYTKPLLGSDSSAPAAVPVKRQPFVPPPANITFPGMDSDNRDTMIAGSGVDAMALASVPPAGVPIPAGATRRPDMIDTQPAAPIADPRAAMGITYGAGTNFAPDTQTAAAFSGQPFARFADGSVDTSTQTGKAFGTNMVGDPTLTDPNFVEAYEQELAKQKVTAPVVVRKTAAQRIAETNAKINTVVNSAIEGLALPNQNIAKADIAQSERVTDAGGTGFTGSTVGGVPVGKISGKDGSSDGVVVNEETGTVLKVRDIDPDATGQQAAKTVFSDVNGNQFTKGTFGSLSNLDGTPYTGPGLSTSDDSSSSPDTSSDSTDSSSGSSSVSIKAGETLSKIAADNNTTVAAIAAANNITDVDSIQAGATLTIPDNNNNSGGDNNSSNNNSGGDDRTFTEAVSDTYDSFKAWAGWD